MPPAARITDFHACPVPTHVGGPVSAGDASVLIGYMPAARVSDSLVCAPGPDAIASGESSVLIGSLPAARLGDPTVHGGKIVVGCPTVLIGSSAQVSTLRTDKPFCEECERKRLARIAAAKDQRGKVAVTTNANAASAAHHGPAATQAHAAPKPVANQKTKPCDFDTVELKCKHCGKPDDRELTALHFKLDAQGKVESDHPRSPNKKRPYLPDRFEVMDGDVVSVKLAGGPGYHDGQHPTITLTAPTGLGDPVVVRGKTHHDFTVKYHPGWFAQRLKQAGSLGFMGALRQFFFPAPAVHALDIASCGVRAHGHAFLALHHAIVVYPSDTFKIALTLPSVKKVEHTSSKMKEGKETVRETSTTVSKGYAATSHTTGEQLRTGGAGTSYTAKESVADRRSGVDYSRTLSEKGGFSDTEEYKDGKAVDRAHVATAKSIEISHNGSDITKSFKVAEFIEFVADIRSKVMDVVEFVQGLAKQSPSIGWTFTFSLELFSGSLEYSWGYKEWAKDHTVYRMWKIEASLTVISCRLELAFGVSLLKAKAQVYGAISGDLKISASKEANPDNVGLMASVSAALTPGGEIGVRGALGDWIEVIGKVAGGFEGSTKIDLSPFKWTFKIDLGEGKGTFTVKSKLGLSYEKKATIWDKRPILAERTIIG